MFPHEHEEAFYRRQESQHSWRNYPGRFKHQAERVLRRAMLWLAEGLLGSANGHGVVFMERLLTPTETCRQGTVNVLNNLTRAILARRENLPAPRFLLTLNGYELQIGTMPAYADDVLAGLRKFAREMGSRAARS